ncbi:MAG: hypothetical protein VKL59_17805 [Nostocaceae cyanobacterium]|nr:hypothetical protein [Nostocaceae cyanobacterium]
MSSEPIKRNRYSYNNRECSFTASNFNQDFDDYHLPVVRTQISSLNEWGIAQGLEISGTIGSNTITIQQGVAIDSNGQLISLSEQGNATLSNNPPRKVAVPVQLDTSTYQADTTYYLTIQFYELEQSQTGRPCNRVLEQVPFLQLQPQTTYVDDGNSVILGQVAIDTQGKIQGLTSTGRRLVSKTVEQLQIKRADKVNDQVQQVSAGQIAPIAGGGLQITVPLATDQMLLAKKDSGNFGKLEVRSDTIQLAGNTGIGTTQPPTEKLEVAGNLKITGARLKSAAGWGIVETDKQDWLRINPDQTYPAIALHKPVAIGTGGLAVGDWTQVGSGELKVTGSAYLATASGNVSIGSTSSPQAKLQIINTSQDANGNTLILGSTDASNLRLGYHTDYSWIQSHGSKPLSINSIGNNVGIGTTTPKSLLEIRKDAPGALGPVLTLANNTGSPGAGAAIDFNGYDVGTNAPTARIQSLDDGNYSSHIAFYTKQSGANTNQLQERLRINSGGNLEVQGDVKASGTIYAGGNPLSYENYEIYLRGSAFESTEGNNTYLKIANVSINITNTRGINTVILNPNGTFKVQTTHDIFGNQSLWNNWADWVNSNAENGDVVAVASYDAVRPAPTGGSAERLLRVSGAVRAFEVSYRIPYTLLFIKGRGGAMEVAQPYQGANAHLKTTYYNLLNNNGAIVKGMIMMWSGSETEIPGGWALCNGQNGTPDLRDKFIVAAGGKYNFKQEGGADSVTLSVNQIPSHNHGAAISNSGSHYHEILFDTGGGGFEGAARMAKTPEGLQQNVLANYQAPTKYAGDHNHGINIGFAGGNAAHENRPPFYALCLIMKL